MPAPYCRPSILKGDPYESIRRPHYPPALAPKAAAGLEAVLTNAEADAANETADVPPEGDGAGRSGARAFPATEGSMHGTSSLARGCRGNPAMRAVPDVEQSLVVAVIA